MAPPTTPILYWRDLNTPATNPLYDTVEELLAAKPTQCLVFDTTNEAVQLEHIIESGDDPITNQPGINPAGSFRVYKQQGRSSVQTLLLEGNSDVAETTWRAQLRSFGKKFQIENQFHKFGIFGFYHPRVPDFNIDPTAEIGYTMAVPTFEYFSANLVHFKIRLSLGVRT